MEVYYVIGSSLAVLALIVSLIGITRKDFPSSTGAEKAVGALFALVVAGVIGAAIIGSANEEEHEESEGESHAALVAPR
jgi:hypothetical protein